MVCLLIWIQEKNHLLFNYLQIFKNVFNIVTGGIPQEVLEMPIDPNEPTYCICQDVSWGEMIGCDNNDCPIEWFHFGCMGLTSKPKGKWYCPKCINLFKKKK